MYHRQPAVYPYSFYQEQFDSSAGFLIFAIKAGGDDFTVIHHQQVAGIKIIGESGKYLMLPIPGFPVQNH
jgi:hypothetical protein